MIKEGYLSPTWSTIKALTRSTSWWQWPKNVAASITMKKLRTVQKMHNVVVYTLADVIFDYGRLTHGSKSTNQWDDQIIMRTCAV